ncbi:MAG TPA: M20/M25/M40 family metallo-hydrolase [Vicinamibacterales bacterium]|jgi:acetylornithine deacetylase/succinyl-diaminopimelate desuccinylase-like protein|nr:M20/M25/M40 family metallo-hydrolase [Vicinamibacterales bacterium]
MSIKAALAAAAALSIAAPARAQTIDWKAVNDEALKTLQAYVRINTSNPPGDVTKAADFLSDLLKREGIDARRYESAPGRSIVLARLKGNGTGGKPILLESHMDVVPTDPSRWSRDPFGAEIADGRMWGRGTIDMKGIGVSYLYAFLTLQRQHAALTRDILLMFVPDEEVGGELGAAWMRKNHYAELDPEYVIDEGGFGSRDMFTAGKLVFGISVGEKKIMWLRLRAEGVAGHGSQPHDRNPNEHLMRALGRLFAEPVAAAPFLVVETMKRRIGAPLAENKFNNAIQRSTISLTSLRSGVGDPPRANVIPSVAEATLDCRVLPGTTAEEWLKLIEGRLADPTIKIEVIYEGDDPVVSPQDTPLYRALEAAIVREHPGAIVTPMTVPYGTDANGYRPRGVKSYGIFPAVVPAASILSMHGDSEFIPVDAVGPAIRILYDALKATASR